MGSVAAMYRHLSKWATSHASESSLLVPKNSKWKDGHSDKQLPRKLYGENCVVLLMNRVYVCEYGHEIEHVSAVNYKMPFALSHKSGVTLDLLNLINSLECRADLSNSSEVFQRDQMMFRFR